MILNFILNTLHCELIFFIYLLSFIVKNIWKLLLFHCSKLYNEHMKAIKQIMGLLYWVDRVKLVLKKKKIH